MADADAMSKSAKRRAAKKARDAAAAETEAPPEPPAPEPKAKAKAKAKAEAAAPKAEPKAKAKAEAKPATPEPKGKAKAKAKAEPAKAPEPEPAPKAKGKAKAKAAPAPAPEPEPAPKAAAKAKGKAKAKAAPKEEPKAPPAPKEVEDLYVQLDDGTGGEWEVSSGLSKKAAKRKEKKDVEEMVKDNIEKMTKAQGLKPGAQQGHIPGMPTAQDIAKNAAGVAARTQAMVDQAVAKTLAAAEAAGKAAAAAGAAAAKESAAPDSSSVATVKVPEKKIGIVIGPKGARIKLIQEKTGVTRIDTSGEVFTISGPPEAVSQAEIAIKELIEKGYMSLEFEDFAENFVKVHPSSFPDLIGVKGAVVRKIKDELKVEVNFPDVPKTGNTGNKTYKVTLAGSNANVEKAKAVINDICTYYHHELTHPGQVHEEMDIEQWAHRFIIGKAGSEMKHIQHNWNVKVNIPREWSVNQKVVVVGEKDSVERAKAYIEKLIYNAENQTKGRDKVDDGDVWGEEEQVEDWMKQYMYKR